MGYCYEEGAGVEKSRTEAFRYFKFAADQGDASRQFHVGCYYCELDNFNKEDAFRYFKLSADQCIDEAKTMVEEFEKRWDFGRIEL